MAATAARVVQLETTAATSLATRAGVEAAVAGLEARAEARLAAVADGCATRGALAALTAATTALSESLTATQGVVSTKVDRADLLRLQTTAAELASFAEWKAATAAGLADVSSRAADTRTALDAAVDSIATLSNVTNALAASLDAKADGGALDAVAASATAAARVAADAAPASALAGVAAGLAAMTHRVGAVEVGLAGAAVAVTDAAAAAAARADEVAAASAAGLAAAPRERRRERAAARADTASRAYVVSLEATDENVTAAQAALDALASKVEVCLRFVEWFAEKGEAYEYNASALERHMNALAVGNRSTPRDRARGVASDLSASYVAASRGGGGGGGAAAAPLVGVPGVRIGGIAP